MTKIGVGQLPLYIYSFAKSTFACCNSDITLDTLKFISGAFCLETHQ